MSVDLKYSQKHFSVTANHCYIKSDFSASTCMSSTFMLPVNFSDWFFLLTKISWEKLPKIFCYSTHNFSLHRQDCRKMTKKIIQISYPPLFTQDLPFLRIIYASYEALLNMASLKDLIRIQ